MTTLGEILRSKLEGTAVPQVEAVALWLDRTETLRWWRVSEQLPPLDADVLMSWGDDQGTWVGAYTLHHGWVGVDAMPVDPPPLYWSAMPVGPVDRAPTT